MLTLEAIYFQTRSKYIRIFHESTDFVLVEEEEKTSVVFVHCQQKGGGSLIHLCYSVLWNIFFYSVLIEMLSTRYLISEEGLLINFNEDSYNDNGNKIDIIIRKSKNY